MSKYYDGTKLLSMKDLNGKTPELFLCTSNRSAGKTTYFSRYLVNRFKNYGEKFGLIYRFNYELDQCADKFFGEIGPLFFQNDIMTSKSQMRGIYHELFLNDVSCGYAISINSADQLKKNSHLFADTSRLLFDEFQSETNHYCNNEIKKFISVHTSIARGGGKQVRYLPVIMLANTVSLINPYYVALGISERLQEKTKFLRGNGFVLEQGYNETAAKEQKESLFNQAFAKSNYTQYSAQAIYLNDNASFIEKPLGSGRYLATILYEGVNYAIKEYQDAGIIYCDDKPDMTYPYKLTISTADHRINYVMLSRSDLFVQQLRWYFEKGCFRFKNLSCKEAILKTISY